MTEVQAFGYPPHFIRDSLDTRQLNDATTSYFLIANKH